MAQVAIFRKDSDEVPGYPSKVSAKVLDAFMVMILSKSRVKRPELIAFFMPTNRGRSGFARLSAVTRPELHHLADCRREGVMTPQATATLAKAWIIPESNLGRAPKSGERDWDSTAQSILLYCKDRIGAYSLSESDTFTVDPGGSDISVTVID